MRVTVVRDVIEEARFELILEHARVNFTHDVHVRHRADPRCVRHQIQLSRALGHATLRQDIEQNITANGGTSGRGYSSVVHLRDVDSAVAVFAGHDVNGSAFACSNFQ